MILRLRGWKWSDFGLRVSMPETIAGSLLFVFYTLIGYTMYQLAAAIACARDDAQPEGRRHPQRS